MAETNNIVFDGSEKDPFTLEQDEWLLQWNRLGRDNLQSDQFQENQMMELKKKLQKMEEIKQKLLPQTEQSFDLLLDHLKKKAFELRNIKCQKEQLIIERDGILLQLEDLEKKLSQNKKMLQQFCYDFLSLSDNILKQCDQLKEIIEESVTLKNELEEKEKDMAFPIGFFPWKQTGSHRLVSLPCGHLFGENCVNDHLARLQECPICRAPAPTHEMHMVAM